MRQYREAELSKPVSKWLESLGYEVYTEVPFYGNIVDMVGKKGSRFIVVELKTGLTKKVVRQAWRTQRRAHLSYCAIATNPRKKNLELCRKEGIGVLRIVDGEVRILVKARLQKNVPGIDLRHLPMGGTAGLPNIAGYGPAQEVKRRILLYRMGRPGASWKELFENIPNHYISYQSMYGGMRTLREILHWRRRQMREAQRKEITEVFQEHSLEEIKLEMAKQLEKKGRGAFASSHEIYGILAEEMAELLQEITDNHPGEENTSKEERICSELRQIGVAAAFGIASIRAGGVHWL